MLEQTKNGKANAVFEAIFSHNILFFISCKCSIPQSVDPETLVRLFWSYRKISYNFVNGTILFIELLPSFYEIF